MLTEAQVKERIEAAGRIRCWYEAVPYGTIKFHWGHSEVKEAFRGMD